MSKRHYRKAMSGLRTSEDFQERTIERLKLEQTNLSHTKKGELIIMENKKKRNKVAAWTSGVAACAVLAVGVIAFNQGGDGATIVPQPTNGIVETQKPASPTTEAPTSAKMMVNIDGIIEEVAADGQSFRIGDLWVTVTDATEYGITGPTAPEPSEQLVSKEFKVGNAVSGFTTGDIDSGKVTAERIYNNF